VCFDCLCVCLVDLLCVFGRYFTCVLISCVCLSGTYYV